VASDVEVIVEEQNPICDKVCGVQSERSGISGLAPGVVKMGQQFALAVESTTICREKPHFKRGYGFYHILGETS
jgi:hypothetical protein